MSALALARPRNSVACEVVEPALDRVMLEAFREACRRVCGKEAAAARAFGFDPGHFSRYINGLEPFPRGFFPQRLALVPDVAIEFAALLAKAVGHQIESRVAAHRRRFVRRHLIELIASELDVADVLGASAPAPMPPPLRNGLRS